MINYQRFSFYTYCKIETEYGILNDVKQVDLAFT